MADEVVTPACAYCGSAQEVLPHVELREGYRLTGNKDIDSVWKARWDCWFCNARSPSGLGPTPEAALQNATMAVMLARERRVACGR